MQHLEVSCAVVPYKGR